MQNVTKLKRISKILKECYQSEKDLFDVLNGERGTQTLSLFFFVEHCRSTRLSVDQILTGPAL